ncbi:HAD-IA family hydrolase [Streptomyces sp. B1866]|uniref:HAD-IA family hydrolase n=1 Tax=Streptomyces sp. B1866 TaxID=3075431 RepID=UPI002891990D|nr:HAD-IA family hydrolase [Streptomyces sp. B1866]MDT3397094.1 HAD-IA family hydrolase [Streptomyces sp. B1866]
MPATTTFTTRAVLLDMDGTLVDSEASVARCWRRWAAEQGLDAEAVLAVVHGRQAHVSMAELLPGRPTERNLADSRRLLEWESTDTEGVVPIPGAPALLAALADHPHALVTSAAQPLAEARMGAAGLPMPPVRVTAEQVGASKPDPEAFLKGAAALGFSPGDCVAFEDSAAGVAAGLAAGMPVVGVGPRAASLSPTAHVRDLEQVTVEPLPDGRLRLHVSA